jgi:hypothetical protein
MKTLHMLELLLFPLLVLSFFHPAQTTIAEQFSFSPTPTYDPLVEPPLPEHPTEYELGRNLYWHWCMTCHGDKGQGLTDEFRGIWEEDHQNCWGRGCHAGHPGDTGFPIPTVVPALVDDLHLAQFASLQALFDFLKATHPPQSPGILKDEEYHAIAFFVFAMNNRSPITIPVTNTPSPMPTFTVAPTHAPVAISQDSRSYSFPIYMVIIGSAFLVGILALATRTRFRNHE